MHMCFSWHDVVNGRIEDVRLYAGVRSDSFGVRPARHVSCDNCVHPEVSAALSDPLCVVT